MHILEIGQAGPLPNNTHRRLIPPNINKNLKPEVNSKKISLGGYQYSFKDVLLGKNMFSYRCVNITTDKKNFTPP